MQQDPLHVRDAHVLELEGIENFRDIGGYLTESGEKVRWGRLFRSGHLANMSSFDGQQLDPLGISHIFDLRSVSEREQFPSLWQGNSTPDITTFDLHDDETSPTEDLFSQIMAGEISREAVEEHMLSDYKQMPYDYAPIIKQLCTKLLADDTGAVVVHCTAGKDRTGLVVALMLEILGVPRKCIAEDYLLSNEGFAAEEKLEQVAEQFRHQVEDVANRIHVLRPLIEVDTAYLDAAFAGLEAEFGSVEGYCQSHLELSAEDLAQIRQSLLC